VQKLCFARLFLAEELLHLVLAGARRPEPAPLLLVGFRGFLELGFLPWSGERRPRLDQVFPLQLCRIMQGRDVRFPGLRVLCSPSLISHIRRVIFVGETGKMVAELVDKDVVGKSGV